MIQEQESTGKAEVQPDITKEVPVVDWWSAGSAAPRPNVGTVPTVVVRRSFARSRLLPGLMVLCGALAMVMSTQAWVTANFLRHMSTVDGTDKVVSSAFGINGWAALGAGAALLVLSAVMMVSDERGLRILTALVAAGTLAIAGYELIRVLQAIHYARSDASRMGPLAAELAGRAHVGYALVVLAAAAGAAFLAGLVEVGSPD